MLFATKTIAEQCRSFIQHASQSEPVHVRLIHFLVCPEDNVTNGGLDPGCACVDLHIALYPQEAFPLAKQFWQHSGLGISSRRAEYCLSLLPEGYGLQQCPSPTYSRFSSRTLNKHYLAKKPVSARDRFSTTTPENGTIETLSNDQNVYVEERYGRNLPLASAASAKRALRRRIAGVLVRDDSNDCADGPCAGAVGVDIGPSSRGVASVTESDVYLFPTGMSAIWTAHHLLLTVRPPAKSVCFG